MTSRKSFIELSRQGKRKRLQNKFKVNGCARLVDENSVEDTISNETSTETTCGNQINAYPLNSDSSSFLDFEISHMSDGDDDIDDDWKRTEDQDKMEENLRTWCSQFNISSVALTALLLILKFHHCFQNLPSDARTLKRTPKVVNTIPVGPGSYSHIGIANSLKLIWSSVVEHVTSIDLLIGIDGLPLFKSGSGEMWPILMSVLNIPSLKSVISPVGIYYGKKKPGKSNEFLRSFVDEISLLVRNGIVLNERQLSVNLKGFCCDAPAKSFILGIKGHTGYSSCTKCKQEGSFYKNRMTFPVVPKKRQELERSLRSTESFLNQVDKEFHVSETILSEIPNINFISSFPLDYMHLVCLGVMRTMLFIWLFAAVPLKLPYRLVSSISNNLLSLQSFVPVEFGRRPRSLDEVKRWKATEYRQFLLYTGPIVLKKVFLPDYNDLYNNFLGLHIAMRILLSPKYCLKHKTYAEEMLYRFVSVFKGLYGQEYLTHNFHGLIHLADDVTTFGPLDTCSAFDFENYLFSLKRLVRKGEKPLQQVVKRICERVKSNLVNNLNCQSVYPIATNEHFSGPLFDGCDSSKQYKKLQFSDFVLTTSIPNSCCYLKDGRVAVVHNIIYSNTHNSLSIVFKYFEKSENFFGYPYCSSSSLDIFLVSEKSPHLHILPAADIVEKIVLLPAEDNKFLAIPLLH